MGRSRSVMSAALVRLVPSMLLRLVLILLDKPAEPVFVAAALSKLFPSTNGPEFLSPFSFSWIAFCFTVYERPSSPFGAKGWSALALLVFPEVSSSAEELLERIFEIAEETGGYLDLLKGFGAFPVLQLRKGIWSPSSFMSFGVLIVLLRLPVCPAPEKSAVPRRGSNDPIA